MSRATATTTKGRVIDTWVFTLYEKDANKRAFHNNETRVTLEVRMHASSGDAPTFRFTCDLDTATSAEVCGKLRMRPEYASLTIGCDSLAALHAKASELFRQTDALNWKPVIVIAFKGKDDSDSLLTPAVEVAVGDDGTVSAAVEPSYNTSMGFSYAVCEQSGSMFRREAGARVEPHACHMTRNAYLSSLRNTDATQGNDAGVVNSFTNDQQVLVVKPYSKELHQHLRALGDKFDHLSKEITRQMRTEPEAFLARMVGVPLLKAPCST